MEELQEKLQGLLSDPESMQQLSELAGMLTQEAPPETPGSAPELPDMGALMKMGQLLQTKETPDANAALLLALRPHLGVRRQARVDKAVRLLRLWRIWQTLQESGMLGKLL